MCLQLDAKQSPLALLAQTCNSIGKDSSSKTIIPPLDKKDAQKDKDAAKSSPALRAEEKSSTPTEKKETPSSPKREPSEDRKTTPRQQHRSPSPAEVRSHSSSHSNGKSGSPAPNSKSSNSTEGRGGSSPAARKSSTPSLSLQSNSKISLNCGSVSVEVKHQESLTSSSPAKSTSSTAQPSYADSIAHGTPLHALPGSYHGLPMLGHLGHAPLDAATAAAAAYYASLPPAHSAAYAGLAAAASAHKGAAGLSPYLQYTSMKTASGTTLVPVCKDPYCNQCQAAARTTAHRASCSPGCTQCTTEKSLNGAAATSLHAPTPLGTGLPGLSASSSTPQSLLSSLYQHHASSVLPGQHTMPVVCNWLQGSDYCGKVFNTSEELLLHLRSHTSLTSLGLSDVSSLPSALPYPNLGLTTAAAAAAHGLQLSYPTQGSRSPNSTLRHAYPRSLSPNGLSALAAGRYHPYKSPLGSLTQPAASLSAAAGIPAHLSPYYLPYSLYGQRLGAAMTP